ncbi:MarR family transcriptional regulator [Streptomyces sp. NPDC047046]|uniref:LexA family protein n=1 Tax=Streptomyces sp. NPDC047046 TaxID=3155378 RepID=UPI0033CE9A45
MKRFEKTRPLILAYMRLRQDNGLEPPYMSEMAQDLAMPLSTLASHLCRLEGEGVVVKRDSHRRPYMLAPENPAPGPSRAEPLSERQARVLVAVNVMTREGKGSPTFREIADALGLASTASIQYQIDRLVARGYLTRPATRKKRALALTPLGIEAITEARA